MSRAIALVCGWFVLAIGSAGAVPSQPRYVPPEAPQPPKLLDLRGTTWRGTTFSNHHMEITLQPDGRLVYHGDQKVPGSWTLIGNQVYFEINNKASEHRGTVSGDVITGISTNDLQKLRSEFKLQRVKP